MARTATRLPPFGTRLAQEGGFTIVEVMVASIVLVVGLGALLGMLMTADHVIKNTRLRQEETSLAREVLEDSRGLSYASLNASTVAAALQPYVPNSTVSGSNLVVTRAIAPSTGGAYQFVVSFSACSLDSPADGYGNHGTPPPSGGSWCPDVAANGSADSNPDDYKRLSATVTPSGQSTPSVQQTVLIYNRPVNGPAVSCLSTTASCPGANVTVTSGTSLTFNVTTTSQAASVKWLVNGSPPQSAQLSGGEADPYSPTGTTSTFNWVYPTTTFNGTSYAIDGNYTISAVAYDSQGNPGSSSTIQVTVNQHQAIPPASLTAGWNDQMNGVDLQWVPSIDQDIQSYKVYNQYNGGASVLVASCSAKATSCTDTSPTAQSQAPPAVGSRPTCTSGSQSYTKTNVYWVVGVDKDTTGSLRESTWTSPTMDANLCDHAPNPPSSLSGTLSGGQLTLNWNAPSPGDSDIWDSIQAWHIYRWASTGTRTDPGSRYQLVGTSPSSPVTSFTDSAPDPSGVTQSYCVTAVDTHLNESPCSNVVTG